MRTWNADKGSINESLSEEEGLDQKAESLIAIAINVRRIFLLMFLGIVVLLLAWGVSLWVSRVSLDPEDADTVLLVSGLFLILITGGGLYYIVTVKRLTKME